MANTLRPFFEARKLTDEELGMVEFVLMSPAYEIAFKPYLEAVRDNMQALWKNRSQKRKDEYPDDFLAGAACAIDDLLKFFAATIAESNFDRIHNSMELSSDEQYTRKLQQGQVAPVVGVNQDATPPPYDPLEDF